MVNSRCRSAASLREFRAVVTAGDSVASPESDDDAMTPLVLRNVFSSEYLSVIHCRSDGGRYASSL